MKNISIIVPVWNEEENIKVLVNRISIACKKADICFEIIFIDDNSTDNTEKTITYLKNFSPVFYYKKQGKKGKAYSLIEGFAKAKYETLAMIDADLQYPPEEVIPMLEKIEKGAGIVVANRKFVKTSKSRKFISRSFRFIFGKLLFGFDHDIQAGLKVFKKEVFETVKFLPKSGWTFDLEFLHRAREAGFAIDNHEIEFEKRINGNSKISFVKTSLEIALNALYVKTKRIQPQHILPSTANSMIGAGVGYKKKKYITHTTINHKQSSLRTIVGGQWFFIFFFIAATVVGFVSQPLLTGQIIIGILSVIYFIDVLFNLFLILKSLHQPQEINIADEEIATLKNSELPVYSILCPLYKEAHILPHFLKSISKLEWPKEKLDVMLLLEEDDKESINAVKQMELPFFVRFVIVPHSMPKTKPKACNYGLNFAKGEYVVIYDAEDMPDPLQLKKAYLAFKKSSRDIVCLQAKLNYYNPNQNLLTRIFTAEYSLWFDVSLTGLQSINTALPLGGTSNHFRRADLQKLEGWDPFNVTEDADLGIRLFKKGYKTAMIDSVTLEEANSKLGNWVRQRSRWIKGYMQTYLVHTREWFGFKGSRGIHALIFHLVIGGKIAFILINPLLWIATISYFTLYAIVGPTIESLYPATVFYMAATSLALGNFLFLYYYMIGLAKRNQWNLIKFIFFVPVYWLMISFAGIIALFQLIFKPHYWEKTLHGLHIAHVQKNQEKEALITAKTNEKKFSSSSITSGGLLITASLVSYFLNFLYNAYLGRNLSVEEFGLVGLVGTLLYLVQLPFGAFSSTVTHRSAFLFGKYNTPILSFWHSARKKVYVISAIITILWLFSIPQLDKFFQSKNVIPLLFFTPVLSLSLGLAVDKSFLGGNLRFKVTAFLLLIESITKLLIAYVIVQIHETQYIYAALPISMGIGFISAWICISKIKVNKEIKVDKTAVLHFPKKMFASTLLTNLSAAVYLSLDVILAKHFLMPKEAGYYALLSLVGKIIILLGILFSQFINPIISREEGAGRNSQKIFYILLLISSFVSFCGFITFGLFARITIPFLFGNKFLPVLSLLPLYTLGMMFFSISACIIGYHQAKKQYIFAIASFLLGILLALGIVMYHDSMRTITLVILSFSILYLGVMLFLHVSYTLLRVTAIKIKSLFTFFNPLKESNFQKNQLSILIFNWYDISHKWAGGAEVYIHEIAKSFVEKGYKVTLFCGNDGGKKGYEVIDGIEVIRKGGIYTVAIWGFLYYMFKLRNSFDVVIDSAKGVPFFTPFYVKVPIIGIVYHLHTDMFKKGLKFPFSNIAIFLEKNLLPFIYKNTHVVTISNSSKKAMEEIGLGSKLPLTIVTPGVTVQKVQAEKSKKPMVLYVGRLRKYKSVETLIHALENVKKQIPDVTCTIAGDGDYREALEDLAHKHHLENSIRFAGKVSETEKAELFKKAWVAVQPSTSEGWGITVIEANAYGTPVVASNIDGLKDSVLHDKTGILVEVKNINEFSSAIIKILKDNSYRETLSKEAMRWSKNFTWDSTTEIFQNIMIQMMIKKSPRKNNSFSLNLSS